MGSIFQSSTTTPLFRGQNNHNLSEAEWRALEQKLRLSGDLIQRDKIMASLRLMATYPMGRLQLRQIIASNQVFQIESSTAGDKTCQQNFAGGYNDKDKTVVYSKLLDNPKALGTVLLHEMMHQRQPRILPANSIIYDMEPQAIDAQLGIEIGGIPEECASYRQSYDINVQNWRDIVAGRKPKPSWAPAFEPIIPSHLSYTQQEKLRREALEGYITQMATMETQAQYMEDFTLSRQSIANGDFSLAVPSYANLRSHGFYDSDSVRRGLTQFRLDEASKGYLRQKYPALDVAKVDRHIDELNSEHAELHNAIGSLVTSLKGKIVPGMTVKEMAKITSASIRKLNCSRDSKRILSEEMMEFFVRNKNNVNIEQISSHLYDSFKETYYHSDGYLEIKRKGIDKEIDKLWDKAQDEGKNPYRAAFDYVAHHDNLSVSARWYQLSEIIRWHKNQYPETTGEKAEFREQLIKEMRQIIGLQGLPIVQNETGLQDVLRSSSDGRVVETEEPTLDTVLPVRSGAMIA